MKKILTPNFLIIVLFSFVLTATGSLAQDSKASSQAGEKKAEGRDAPLWNEAQETGSLQYPVIKKIKEGVLTVDNILVDKEIEAVTIKGEVNMREGIVEYIACSNMGKLHESVLKLDVEPYYLQIALLLLNLEPGQKPISGQGSVETPEGDPVEIWVMWKDANDKIQKYRGEDLVLDNRTQKAMHQPNWVFTGSQVLQGKFMAQVEKSIVATYHDPFAIIDHQLATGADDTIYVANNKILPPVGTEVSFTIQSIKKP